MINATIRNITLPFFFSSSSWKLTRKIHLHFPNLNYSNSLELILDKTHLTQTATANKMQRSSLWETRNWSSSSLKKINECIPPQHPFILYYVSFQKVLGYKYIFELILQIETVICEQFQHWKRTNATVRSIMTSSSRQFMQVSCLH